MHQRGRRAAAALLSLTLIAGMMPLASIAEEQTETVVETVAVEVETVPAVEDVPAAETVPAAEGAAQDQNEKISGGV